MYDLKKDGFTIIKDVFSEEQLEATRDLLSKLVEYHELNYADPFEKYYLPHRNDQGVLYDLFQRHPEFDAFVRASKIREALETVLGDSFFLYENSMVYKPKGKQNGVPWHQDFISRPDEPIKYIAWMAIDEVTKSSGALKVVPGSHKLGFLPWHRVKGETHHDRLDTSKVDLSKSIHVELEPGDVLIFNQLVVHSSDDMQTDSMRFVYRASYQSFDQIFTPRATPIVINGGHASALNARFTSPEDAIKPKSFINRAINKIGRKLASL